MVNYWDIKIRNRKYIISSKSKRKIIILKR